MKKNNAHYGDGELSRGVFFNRGASEYIYICNAFILNANNFFYARTRCQIINFLKIFAIYIGGFSVSL